MLSVAVVIGPSMRLAPVNETGPSMVRVGEIAKRSLGGG